MGSVSKIDKKRKGFTLVEMLIVIGIITLLSPIVIVSFQKAFDKTYETRALAELRSFESALYIYLIDNEEFPEDVDRDLPVDIKDYLSPGNWPKAPWPGSVYDWDNWEPDDLIHSPNDKRVVQISIRFCPIGGPITKCNFPKQEWANNFDVDSGFFYCIQGACRSHSARPLDYPGYCVNCPQKTAPYGF